VVLQPDAAEVVGDGQQEVIVVIVARAVQAVGLADQFAVLAMWASVAASMSACRRRCSGAPASGRPDRGRSGDIGAGEQRAVGEMSSVIQRGEGRQTPFWK
jgi:hypothetical protein